MRETFETKKKERRLQRREKRKRMVKHYRWRRSMVDKLLFKTLSLPPSLSLSLSLSCWVSLCWGLGCLNICGGFGPNS